MILHQETTDANEDPLRDDEVLIIQVQEQPGTNRHLSLVYFVFPITDHTLGNSVFDSLPSLPFTSILFDSLPFTSFTHGNLVANDIV